MIESGHKTDSKSVLLSALQRFSDAGGSLIQIRAREPLRAAAVLREHFTEVDNPYHEWSASNGFRTFTAENYNENLVKGDEMDFVSAFVRPINELRSPTSEVCATPEKVHYFAYLDPEANMVNNPFVLDLLYQYAQILPTSNVVIVFVTPDRPLEPVPQGLLLTTTLPTPTVDELQEVLESMVDKVAESEGSFESEPEITPEEMRRVALLGLGLTYFEFESHVALAAVTAAEEGATALTAEHLSVGVAKGKTEVVRQSEILELVPSGDMENVGGMQRLKNWVDQRANCYSEDAKEFGIEPPKGLVLVGVPGTGKSLVAKAVATVLGVPLVRLDFARVFSKYVGDSESRVRSALNMVEAMSPCVLFVDEIDKGLGGIGAGGDSGTSMRVLGTYLTWLQELSSPVFNMVTANRVEGLPPELLRRGRFDQIFSVSMPTAQERKEVFEIHLRKRGRDIKDFTPAEVAKLLAESDGYVPAEIESAVKDGLVAAFSAGEDLSCAHIVNALHELIPMSKSHADKIRAIVKWSEENAIPVNYPEASKPVASRASGRRVIIPGGSTKGK